MTKGVPTEAISGVWGVGGDVVLGEAGAGGDQVGGDSDVDGQRPGCGDAGAGDHAVGVALDVDADQAGEFLKRVVVGRVACHAGQDEGGADVGVAGERHLGLWGEDADAGVVLRVIRGQDEGGFRQVEVGGNGLHVGVAEAAGIGQHGERIATEAALGEHVDGNVVIAGHCGLLPTAGGVMAVGHRAVR